MPGKAIQICGTGSDVGKSIIAAGLCRIFLQDGYTVAPFKSQNMSLNSYVTHDAKEIARSQVVQAQASRIEPDVNMNPILLKPTNDMGSQVVLMGKPIGNMHAREYEINKKKFLQIVQKSLDKLRDEYEIVVIEGAGSPAEINLKENDIVNLKMAEYADAPVILIGDIDKGGVFAWLIGTLALLTEQEKKRVKGLIINKFRGDISLLQSGLDFLEEYTGIKVLGVLPYFKDINIAQEDSVFLDKYQVKKVESEKVIRIAVIKLPQLSNFTDFEPFFLEPDVQLSFVAQAEKLNDSDVIIIPGSKNTIKDLKFLKDTGLAAKIQMIMQNSENTKLIGICGGYQMLGQMIQDNNNIESDTKEIAGLGYIPMQTKINPKKTLNRINAKHFNSGKNIFGYEIHHGESTFTEKVNALFEIVEKNGEKIVYKEGFLSNDGSIMGSYIHGLFDADDFRRYFINQVRTIKKYKPLSIMSSYNQDLEFDKLAKLLRENLDLKMLYKILNKK